jgi:hypothetical protein
MPLSASYVSSVGADASVTARESVNSDSANIFVVVSAANAAKIVVFIFLK